ncbi:hypothetical protein GCM10014715_44960 [Streptomyces spiralis]|uniref:Uncharacterized protein n=1 Tax=Streptomyces spiralis TaxID=66376 RepID=A0A919DVM1_9ACTN|nr:hypothetical protein [Streptomyces spiralis]GHE84022.1 hypothetical protein GCM10014715_44960 [Streptomyces spiralis]
MTLDDLAVPLRALRLLAVDFGHLPAPDVDVSLLYPEQLRLAFHDTSCESLAAFEEWRTALQIAPDAVDSHTQSDGQTLVLKAEGPFAGAVVMLTAYADVPVNDRAPAGQAGGAQ